MTDKTQPEAIRAPPQAITLTLASVGGQPFGTITMLEDGGLTFESLAPMSLEDVANVLSLMYVLGAEEPEDAGPAN